MKWEGDSGKGTTLSPGQDLQRANGDSLSVGPQGWASQASTADRLSEHVWNEGQGSHWESVLLVFCCVAHDAWKGDIQNHQR